MKTEPSRINSMPRLKTMARSQRNMDWSIFLANLLKRRQGLGPWVVALSLFAASILVRVALSRWLEPYTLLTLFPAILASAVLCGPLQASVVLILSALSALVLLIPPIGALETAEPTTMVSLTSFLLVGAFDIVLVGAISDLVRRLDHAKRAQENLLRELQHRVANNMQVVLSILQNARRGLPNDAAVGKIDEAEARISAMARLHRRFCDRSAYGGGLEPLLGEILQEAFCDLPVQIKVNARSRNLSVDQMTSIVLLVNEAAINAAKHAFGPGHGASFEVDLSERADGRFRLLIRDDGPGIDRAAGTASRTSFGMSVMRAFAGQLGGSLEVLDGPGTTLSVEFSAG